MQLDKTPFFRKAITPWYDSNFACWLLIGFMTMVFAFACCGILVGLSTPYFERHAWFPAMLAGLSLFLVIKVFLRLRYRAKTN